MVIHAGGAADAAQLRGREGGRAGGRLPKERVCEMRELVTHTECAEERRRGLEHKCYQKQTNPKRNKGEIESALSALCVHQRRIGAAHASARAAELHAYGRPRSVCVPQHRSGSR